MDVFRQLKPYFWPEKKLFFGAIACLAIATALGLVYPNLLRYLIDNVITKKQFDLVPRLALLVVCVVSLKGMFQFLHGFCGGRLGNRVAYHLRNELYQKLQYLSFQYYDGARTGDLMSRLTADLEAIRQFIGFGFAQLLNVGLMFVFGMAMMFSINWKLALLTMITMPFLAFTAIRFEGKIHPAFRMVRQSLSTMTTAVQENITGVRTVKSFAREPHEIDKFSARNEDYKSMNLGSASIWAKYFPVMEILANLSVVILLGVGGFMVIQDTISLGELVACFSLIWYIIGPMWGLGFQINNFTNTKASGEKILDILHHYVHVKDAENAKVLGPSDVKGHVKFDHVTFAYPEKQPALYDFTLDAPPGSVIGLLGSTGSGKTTVISLLMRAYGVKEGKVMLDGQDIRSLQIESYRSQIATVFQETFLFSSSIRNNIAYGVKDATMDDIIRAAKLAKAHDFISELPEGYDTVVGERGLGLSGGQKQRIAIARALLKDPKILVLDDATSAVDMETEHEIQAGFAEVMKGRTTFIIAHRISSLKHADEIIVLNKGRIVQRGTHQELLEQPGLYRQTYDIQYADKQQDAVAEAAAAAETEEERILPSSLQERRLAH
ncbi:ABC transporter ATP-binding protein [Paenibacillus whitsoniae]|uniref:ABC transporter ATP-binding protein n=1 Tax=Paenibacillus whitsoniae TaxID=2496558 RepID=A0A3S0BX99_9BACL|nr:ABC transporter ATP-binding protein [Paenibacillus whitsoniae]RTE10380.1 ABC transporter ATP-binding protein [Paenibacillus whitsoniae]